MTIQDERIVGGIGLHYVCCQISRRGWIVSLTRKGWKHISRNISGVDIVMRNKDSTSELTIQIFAVLNSEPIPFGNAIEDSAADFVILCRSIEFDKLKPNSTYPIPEIFIITKKELINSVIKKTDNDDTSYWLKESEYKTHKDKWEKIGFG